MTTAELLQRLPLLREMFPQEIQMDWSMDEVLKAQRRLGLVDWDASDDLVYDPRARSQHL